MGTNAVREVGLTLLLLLGSETLDGTLDRLRTGRSGPSSSRPMGVAAALRRSFSGPGK